MGKEFGGYEVPRPGKLLRPMKGKWVGREEYKDFKAGTRVKVQRDPKNFGQFIIFFKYTSTESIFAKFDAKDLPETIQYTDARGNL